MVLEFLNMNMPDYELVSREQVLTQQGLPAEILTVNSQDGQFALSRFIYLPEGDVAFNATYYGTVDQFEELAPLIDYSFSTFNVTGSNGALSSTQVTPLTP